MNKCRSCGKEAIVRHENGYWYCNNCVLNVYRVNDLNRLCIKMADLMRSKGIKEGSFWWMFNNIQMIKRLLKGKARMDWKDSIRNAGIWKTMQQVFIWYFLT